LLSAVLKNNKSVNAEKQEILKREIITEALSKATPPLDANIALGLAECGRSNEDLDGVLHSALYALNAYVRIDQMSYHALWVQTAIHRSFFVTSYGKIGDIVCVLFGGPLHTSSGPSTPTVIICSWANAPSKSGWTDKPSI
jgi:hypothetical protein